MTARRILFLFLLLPFLNAQEPTPSPSPEDTPAPKPLPAFGDWVDGLDDAQVQKALEAIETHFHGAETLDAAAKQRALLEGLAGRLAPGVAAGSGSPALSHNAPAAPFLAEILDGSAGYIRLGSLDGKALTQMDAALENFTVKQVPALILDLRGVSWSGGFEAAADVARRFTPKGKILFTIQNQSARQERILTSDNDPLFSGILLVLVDGCTSGAPEVLAATLRENADAMVLGEATAGEGVEFGEFQLGGDKVLRVAVSRVVLPGGSMVFPGGVRPDVPVSLDSGARERIFELSQTGGVSRFVFDVERPRLNEAALVANTNPEISPSSADESTPAEPKDKVLQRAVDLVTAILFYKK